MIRSIEALNYRCLKFVRRELSDFQVLVGSNASGKSTFLDVPAFLGDLVSEGLEHAVQTRTENYEDLFWGRSGGRFELAVELEIPEAKRDLLTWKSYNRVRYEVVVGIESATDFLSILGERVLLKEYPEPHEPALPGTRFPVEREPPPSLIASKTAIKTKWVLNKIEGGADIYYVETGSGNSHTFRLGPRKCALRNLPDDESQFPVSTWLRHTLSDGIARLVLTSEAMRRPSSHWASGKFVPDGSSLPWAVDNLLPGFPETFQEWICQLKKALPELETIRTTERPEDRHRYLVVVDRNGMEMPSWLISDGTLRLIAMTLIAYLPTLTGIWLVEEPENGIHPTAIRTMFHALSSAAGGQILLATHSPLILNMARPAQVLCFARTETGSIDIVRADEHPRVNEPGRQRSLGELFAAGLLG